MRYILIACIVFTFMVTSVAIIASASNNVTTTSENPEATEVAKEDCARVYPIAAGVWYPTDGPLPENPVRYYRARCFPGCHTGSKHGMYPDEKLEYEPIFPTSTIDNYTKTEQKE